MVVPEIASDESDGEASVGATEGGGAVDVTEPVDRLLRHLRTSSSGLSPREAERRLLRYGPNTLERRGGRHFWKDLGRQFTHPLALLLWAGAGLAWLAGIVAVALAIVAVIVLNAVFAFVQERHAERAVEALRQYLPQHAKVLRDGKLATVEAASLVPGDVVVIEEGDRISADGRLLTGALEVDASTLTGESVPVARSAGGSDAGLALFDAPDLVFSGTSCTGGEAQAVVVATGMHTELGRIAALSERVGTEESPLEHQVRRVAWLIAAIAVVMATAFLPLATLGAGLSFSEAVVFAVGLIAGNVPEGLLPVITLALAIGVRGLARRGAVVKRLSAVETLGSTNVICTDKTGTLTQNRMRVAVLWTLAGEHRLPLEDPAEGTVSAPVPAPLATVMAACNNARCDPVGDSGDATEIALLETAALLGADTDADHRNRNRLRLFRFDPVLKLMSTIDERAGAVWVHTKGAPEMVLHRCTAVVSADGRVSPLTAENRAQLAGQVDRFAAEGLRVLALAERQVTADLARQEHRALAERELVWLGLVGLTDPVRPEVAEAVRRCHAAGIRIIVVSGDHPLTARAIAHQVGIGLDGEGTIIGEQLDRMTDAELDSLLRQGEELIFARISPEAKLRIADSLRAQRLVVAMTGDGVNDAPALRRADIGIAMGSSGTDVAREASVMVLTDDNFATIAAAVEAGRRVYDNIRKFIVYIFAHATPEVVPFLFFALGRGAIPLPLTVLQLLAFDVGTETIPALALGREPAEPDIMQRPPRRRDEGVIRPAMLLRAWLFLGLLAAALQMTAFFYVLQRAGWHLGDSVASGTPLHQAYLQATTMTFLSMVVAQIGTAFASRTEHVSLRSIGVFSNRLLLVGIGFELGLAAMIIYLPPFQRLLGTTALPAHLVLITLPFPFIVWGADELRRYLVRRRAT